MKQLYVIRHAKSDWSNPEWTDFSRPLNQRGLLAAPKMGAYLKSLDIMPDIIYSSDANRALTTARYLAEKVGYDTNAIIQNHSLYESTLAQYLSVITAIDDIHSTAWIVGHNPIQTLLVQYCTDAPITHLPTCAVAHIEFDIPSWNMVSRSLGNLRHLYTPKTLWGDDE